MQTAPQYLQLNKGGSMARLSILKMAAFAHNMNRPPSMCIDWRAARRYSFGSWAAAYCALSQGFNGTDAHKVPVWYAHDGGQFRNEKYADECADVGRAINHTGWFCDEFQASKTRGIVGMLTHGRYIAGYELSDSGERVYFGDVHTSERDAALTADEHARINAEREWEYQAHYREAQKLEDENESSLARIRECIKLRNIKYMEYIRDELRECIESIRDNRKRLQTEFKGVL